MVHREFADPTKENEIRINPDQTLFTGRKREIVQAIAEGYFDKDSIAERVGMPSNTVKVHLYRQPIRKNRTERPDTIWTRMENLSRQHIPNITVLFRELLEYGVISVYNRKVERD